MVFVLSDSPVSLNYRTTWDFSSVQTATATGSKELLSQDHRAQHVFLSQGCCGGRQISWKFKVITVS